jgi:hypothetical protein
LQGFHKRDAEIARLTAALAAKEEQLATAQEALADSQARMRRERVRASARGTASTRKLLAGDCARVLARALDVMGPFSSLFLRLTTTPVARRRSCARRRRVPRARTRARRCARTAQTPAALMAVRMHPLLRLWSKAAALMPTPAWPTASKPKTLTPRRCRVTRAVAASVLGPM